jgi:hypothetical protein
VRIEIERDGAALVAAHFTGDAGEFLCLFLWICFWGLAFPDFYWEGWTRVSFLIFPFLPKNSSTRTAVIPMLNSNFRSSRLD